MSAACALASAALRVAVVPDGAQLEGAFDQRVRTLAEAIAWAETRVGTRVDTRVDIRADGAAYAGVEFVLAPCTHQVLDTVAPPARIAPWAIRTQGGRARIVGAEVSADARWEDPPSDLVAQLPEASRAHVRAWTLPEPSRARLAGPVHSGHGIETAAIHSELFVDGIALTPARWPNAHQGYATIAELIDAGSVPRNGMDDIPLDRRVVEADRGGVFVPAERARAARWSGAVDAWAFGFWNWDWSSEQLPIASVEAASGAVRLAMPHRYGLAARGRFAVINLLPELDAEGEYWIDRTRGIVCAWLPPNPGECAVSLASGPFVRCEGAADCVIEGIDFALTRGSAIEAIRCERMRVTQCTFRNLGTRAILLDGLANTVSRCAFEEIGGAGIVLRGGDRPTLARGEGAVEDCVFRECARVSRSYSPAVTLEGVGNRVSHCLFERHPHIALWFRGNDHLIEANEFSRIVYETGDAGAVYVGRDWTAQGTVIRGNYFHDIHGSDGRFQNAVYLDDMSSGITVEGNWFVDCNWGVLVGGGRDDTLRANTFVRCGKAVSWDARGVGWMASEIKDPATSTLLRGYAAMPVASAAWMSRYPHLGDYLTERFGRPVRGVLAGSRLVDTPIGRIDDRECVSESGTVVLDSAGIGAAVHAESMAKVMADVKAAGVGPRWPHPGRGAHRDADKEERCRQ